MNRREDREGCFVVSLFLVMIISGLLYEWLTKS